jgi:TetR/AcrR family transcriptional repressor of nem operon
MPRVSRQQSDNNRASIAEVSSRLFRERGIKGLSVNDLMSAAGLTHGGFYGHFESKDALAAEACRLAFRQSARSWRKRAAETADVESIRSALVEGYLSAKARANPGASCPATALAGDVAREPPGAPIRKEFASGIEELMQIFQSLQRSGAAATDRCEALADFSTMVGALMLSRATSGEAISDEILNAARTRLVCSRQPARRRPSRGLRP